MSRPVSSLLRDDDNDLQSNYKLHDIGEAYLTEWLQSRGYYVEQWGLDNREDTDTLQYDDRMDIRVWDSETKVKCHGLVDVKTKSSHDWLGIFNERHLVKYARWAALYDVPVVVFFTLVDTDHDTVGDETFIVEIPPFDGYEQYYRHYTKNGVDAHFYMDSTDSIVNDCPVVKRTFGADDANTVVVCDESHYQSLQYFEHVLDN